jgi:hypothetical protein
MVQNARTRAKASGVPCTIKPEDITVPTHCPVFGIPLYRTTGTPFGGPNSPALDKIVPELGYVPGNVIVVSRRANDLKKDATLDELRRLASFYSTLRGDVIRVRQYGVKDDLE